MRKRVRAPHAAASKKYCDIASPSNAPCHVERPQRSRREQSIQLRAPLRHRLAPSRAQLRTHPQCTAHARFGIVHGSERVARRRLGLGRIPDDHRHHVGLREQIQHAARVARAANESRTPERSSPGVRRDAAPPASNPSMPPARRLAVLQHAQPSRSPMPRLQQRPARTDRCALCASNASMPSASPTRNALWPSASTKSATTCSFGPTRAEAHRRGHIDDDVHGHGRALAMHAHEPIAAYVAQTRTQVQAARIRPVVQIHVRDEFLSRARGSIPGCDPRRWPPARCGNR